MSHAFDIFCATSMYATGASDGCTLGKCIGCFLLQQVSSYNTSEVKIFTSDREFEFIDMFFGTRLKT